MKKNRAQYRNLFILLIFIIVLSTAIFLIYSYYFKINLSNLYSYKQEQEQKVILPTLSSFATDQLDSRQYYELQLSDRLEYNEQALGISSGSAAPVEPQNVEIYDPKIGETLIIFWQEPNYAKYDAVNIYRANKSTKNKDLIAEGLNNTGHYKDTDLENNDLYFYEVRSYSSATGESENNIEYTGTPTDQTAPSTPQDLLVENTYNGEQIQLTWTNPKEEDFDHVIIYRSQKQGQLDSDNKVIKVNNNNEEKGMYIDDGVADNILYYYTVTSVDVSGNESTTDILISTVGNPDPFNFSSISEMNTNTNTNQNLNTNQNE